MNQYISIENAIRLVPILIGFYYFVALLKSHLDKKNGVQYIGFLILMIISIEAFSFTDLIKSKFVYFLIPIFIGVSLSFAPTLYVFILRQTKNKISNIKVLFIPIILLVFCDVLIFGYLIYFGKSSSFYDMAVSALWILNIGIFCIYFIIQNALLLRKSLHILNDYEISLANYYSFEDGISLNWLKKIIYGYIIFVIALVIVSIPGFDTIIPYSFDAVILVFVFYVGSSALKHLNRIEVIQLLIKNQVLLNTIHVEEDLNKAEIVDEKSNEEIKLIGVKLKTLMETKKPYLNSNLTIVDLARYFDVNYKVISKVINQEFNMNFVSFINMYRIEEAKMKLKSSETNNFKIEAIAELVGFHSKSAFNTAFKKFVGFTPSEFRDTLSKI